MCTMNKLIFLGITIILLFGSLASTRADNAAQLDCNNYVKSLKISSNAVNLLIKTLCEKAKDNDEAKVRLGVLFTKSTDNVVPNYKEASKWFMSAVKPANAKPANAKSAYNLAILYSNGWGVPIDDTKATQYFRIAAESGVISAQYNLGVRYAQGKGVPKSDVIASSWYAKAAEKGMLDAQFNLGVRYYKGLGVEKNYISAYKWLNLATVLGSKRAKIARELVGQSMDGEQIEQAMKLSAEYFSSKPQEMFKK